MEILIPHPHPEISSIKIQVYRNRNSLKTSPISLRFSAQLHRPRKNHLRKKLQLPSITTSSPTKPPIHDTDSLSISISNPNSNDEIKTRALWNQLETWATQYKADAEFRGIVNDKLNKVDVNEDEILTPSNSINNLNYDKISSVFNSSVRSYALDTIKTKPAKIGISVFSCFLVFLAFKSVFRIQKEELSSLEKEMLIRKMKAREKSTKAGDVEVIQDSEKPQMAVLFKERPQVDKQELMNTIVASNDNISRDFDGKIQEIRAMARHAREIEKPDGNTINREDDDDDDDVSINNQPNEEEVLPQGDFSGTLNGLTSQEMGDQTRGNLLDKKPRLRIISSVKEAREYLDDKKKHDKNEATVDQLPEKMFDSKSLNDNKSKEEEERVDLGRGNREKWMEDNFNEFEPIVDKIRGGFRNNYMVAKEKVKEDLNLVSELEVESGNESEFEWMKDEKLKEIVFQVRENELTGRDPFYLMDNEDKALFFKGLEKKVEKENEKLAHLHQYLHSNIENLDYGADGISLYDPLEKMIPRWKGPPPTGAHVEQRKTALENTNFNQNKTISKTVIERSDGSIKPGTKSGKEFWQHTKKWSRGFLDSYNSENDPETKAVMKDIGKDLDRWITEKEIQDAADVMDKLPDKGKTLITEKIQKLKREMEVFGPQAVVRKYSEYGDEKEVDYYWWLDLPFVLCIELYVNGDGDGDERVGFYSLEMAPDLELDPKPCHIIAFEDAGDCKNLCYIIQAHMEMLGNGHAFVVPQPPKDTYQEAKGNGFNVTVIRKGEVKLDVDQTLEEVEDKIVEIGSQMYHDKIIKDRNVDVDSLIKGVFGLDKSKPPRRRPKKKLKKPTVKKPTV